jgi:hypothetical protein
MRAPLSRLVEVIVALAPLPVASCSATVENFTPTTYNLVVSPADGTSGLNTLEVDLGVAPPPRDNQILGPIVAETTFATWPDLAPISTMSASIPGPTRIGGLAFTPVAAVAEGWYVIILPRQPATLNLALGAFHLLPDGRPGVRVRVGSAPRLSSVNVCPNEGNTTAVLVAFSEIVHPATTSAMPLTVTAGPPTGLTGCSTGEVPLVDRPLRSYYYVCPTALGPHDVVSISVTAGLVSNPGVDVPVTERVAALETLLPDALIAGCSALELDP